jgi:hypothetical protein
MTRANHHYIMNIIVHIYYTSYFLDGSSDGIAAEYIISNVLLIPATSLVTTSPAFCGSGIYNVKLSGDTPPPDNAYIIIVRNEPMINIFKNMLYIG